MRETFWNYAELSPIDTLINMKVGTTNNFWIMSIHIYRKKRYFVFFFAGGEGIIDTHALLHKYIYTNKNSYWEIEKTTSYKTNKFIQLGTTHIHFIKLELTK